MDLSQSVTQALLVTQAEVDSEKALERIALFDASGDPVQSLESVGGGDVVLTGLTTGTNAAPVATDTVNEGIAKVHAEVVATRVGSAVLLTGLAAGTATAVAATDTVNQAIAKLQAQIDALST
jgi:hypothetical protein